MSAGPYPTKMMFQRLQERLLALATTIAPVVGTPGEALSVFALSVSAQDVGEVLGLGFASAEVAAAALAVLDRIAINTGSGENLALIQAQDVSRAGPWLFFPLGRPNSESAVEVSVFLRGALSLEQHGEYVPPAGYRVAASQTADGAASSLPLDVRLLCVPRPHSGVPVSDAPSLLLSRGLEIVDDPAGGQPPQLRFRAASGQTYVWTGAPEEAGGMT